eukprot:UN08920
MKFENTNIKLQQSRFMDMFATVISQLDEPKILIKTLNEISKTHSNVYHVQKRNYIDFRRGFMKAIKRELKSQSIWTVEHEIAWQWFWQFIISVMCPEAYM